MMYALEPTKVYMLDEVEADEAASRRMGRILSAIGVGPEDVVRVTEENLVEVVAEIQEAWPPPEVPDGTHGERMRSLIFTLFPFGDAKPDVEALMEKCPEGTPRSLVEAIFGCFKTRNFRERQFDQERNHVCWTAWEFGTMTGCPHGCQYCGYGRGGKFISVALNVEEFIEHVVTPTLNEVPWQKCFRMIGWGSDQIVFEPEYGLFDLLTRKMAEFGDRYAIIHTASANVQWIADLPHRDRLIFVWSMPSITGADQIEPAAPSAIERLQAAGFCQDLGLSVRFKFKPIIPIRNWREDYAQTIEEMFTRTRPDSVGLCVLMWMPLASLRNCIDTELLDPEHVAAMEEAAEAMNGVHTGPFPHHVRAEIYRFLIGEIRRWDEKVPVYISTESREMWDELGGELGQSKRAFICGCGPMTVPGKGLVTSPTVRYTTYEKTGG